MSYNPYGGGKCSISPRAAEEIASRGHSLMALTLTVFSHPTATNGNAKHIY